MEKYNPNVQIVVAFKETAVHLGFSAYRLWWEDGKSFKLLLKKYPTRPIERSSNGKTILRSTLEDSQ